jgi:hypothetical protein
MLRKDMIVCKTRNLLHEFMAPIIAEVDKPRQKFLPQAIRGILLSGSLVVTEFARWVHDDCSDPYYRLKRLLNHLVSPRGHLDKAINAYRRHVGQFIEPDTPLIIDMTDLAKPRARRMKYLAMVRDGSEGKLVRGYWCIEVYAHLKQKRILPLALDAYSIDDPSIGSENLQIQRVVEGVDKYLDGRGIWIADRGFDRSELYEMWLSRKCHFVVRQRGDRSVITDGGVRVILKDFVEVLRQRRVAAGLSSQIIYSKVYLPDHPKTLYVVACWLPKQDDPLILLTTLVVENLQQACQILSYYKRRWACEEAAQFLKSRVGLERFRIRRYQAIQRLAILAMLSMAFLTWILLRSRDLTKRLFSLTSQFRKDAAFIYYRLMDGLKEFARLYPTNLIKPPPDMVQNG